MSWVNIKKIKKITITNSKIGRYGVDSYKTCMK